MLLAALTMQISSGLSCGAGCDMRDVRFILPGYHRLQATGGTW